MYVINNEFYSDRSIIGYFETEKEAIKYVAVKNKGNIYGKYWYEKVKKIEAKMSKDIKANVLYHIFISTKNNKLNMGSIRSYPYVGEKISNNFVCGIAGSYVDNNIWAELTMEITCESKEKAIKIATDKATKFLSDYIDTESYSKACELNDIEKDKNSLFRK